MMSNNTIMADEGEVAVAKWNFHQPSTEPDTVKIMIDSEKATFYARKSSLCQGSGYFNIAFTHGFKETETGIIELDSSIFDSTVLLDILRYLHGLETNFGTLGWRRIVYTLQLYRQARYLQVNGITDIVLQRIRYQVNIADIRLNDVRRRWTRPEQYMTTWKVVLVTAQMVFSQVNADMSDDCEEIREIYMGYLHKNYGVLMGLGEPFARFMRRAPDVCFFMMKDAHENKDRSILNPQGFSSTCVFCGNLVGGSNPFFILVSHKHVGVRHICRKVSCRRMVKKGDF